MPTEKSLLSKQCFAFPLQKTMENRANFRILNHPPKVEKLIHESIKTHKEKKQQKKTVQFKGTLMQICKSPYMLNSNIQKHTDMLDRNAKK